MHDSEGSSATAAEEQRGRPENGESWDCVIVGGGPAGLSAAVYMGRFRRRTLLLDDGKGRWSYGQPIDNYLGFPAGVSARRLHRLSMQQAARFGVETEASTVTALERDGDGFRVSFAGGGERARTVIWAAGVADIWPRFPYARTLVGASLFWCIVCDGFRVRGAPLVLFGNQDTVASTALQFLSFSDQVTLLVDPSSGELSRGVRRRLGRAGIEVREGRVRGVERDGEGLRAVRLAGGERIEAAYLFSLLGSQPRTALLAPLGVALDEKGHVRVDDKNRTTVANLFAAGDVTARHSHQVATAVHEGAQAAMAANQVLYPPRQRLKAPKRRAEEDQLRGA